jgi:hypothetical protein
MSEATVAAQDPLDSSGSSRRLVAKFVWLPLSGVLWSALDLSHFGLGVAVRDGAYGAVVASAAMLLASAYRCYVSYSNVPGVRLWMRLEGVNSLALLGLGIFDLTRSHPSPWPLIVLSGCFSLMVPVAEVAIDSAAAAAHKKRPLEHLRDVFAPKASRGGNHVALAQPRPRHQRLSFGEVLAKANPTPMWWPISWIFAVPERGKFGNGMLMLIVAMTATCAWITASALAPSQAIETASGVAGAVYTKITGGGSSDASTSSGQTTSADATTTNATSPPATATTTTRRKKPATRPVTPPATTTTTTTTTTPPPPPVPGSDTVTWQTKCGANPAAGTWAADAFFNVYLLPPNGLGYSGGGCTGPLRYAPGNPDAVYVIGRTKDSDGSWGRIESVAIYEKGAPAASYYIAPAATLALQLINRYGAISGPPRIPALNGDLYLIWTPADGTVLLIRDETTDRNGHGEAYLVVPPAIVELWIADMETNAEWLWIVYDGVEQQNNAERYRFVRGAVRQKTIDSVAYDPERHEALRSLGDRWVAQPSDDQLFSAETIRALVSR